MNYLALIEDEYLTEKVVVSGERATYLKKIHNVAPNTVYELACIGAGTCLGRVEQVGTDSVTIVRSAIVSQDPPTGPTVVCGACRPQSVKKILQLCIAFSVKEIIFTGSDKSEQSYLLSKIMQQDSIRRGLFVEAIEQSGRVHIPKFSICKNFRALRSWLTANHPESRLLLAAQHGKHFMRSIVEQASDLLVLIGPEAGWSASELNYFESLAAQQISLAPGVLRVEQAVAAMLAVLYTERWQD